jgi:hypothetical protein
MQLLISGRRAEGRERGAGVRKGNAQGQDLRLDEEVVATDFEAREAAEAPEGVRDAREAVRREVELLPKRDAACPISTG